MTHTLRAALCGWALIGAAVASAPLRAQTSGGPAALRDALAAAACGARVAVAPGRYDGDYTLARRCPTTQPIVVAPAGDARGTVTFTNGSFTLDGAGLVLRGMTFDHASIRLQGDHDRATRNTVRHATRAAIVAQGSYHVVDRNAIDSTDGVGIEVALQGNGRANFGTRVERNHIADQVGDGNGHEGIRALVASYDSSGVVIEGNLLERVDVAGEGEAISIKTRGVVVRGNTLLDSPRSYFTNRHGSDNLYEANYFERSGGMYVYGDRHVIRGNTFRDAVIHVLAGNGTQDTEGCVEHPRTRPTTPDCKGIHPAARDVLIVDNSGARVLVGSREAGESWGSEVAASGTRVVRSGRPELLRQTGTRVELGAPRGPFGRKLAAGEVGPAAPERPAP